MTIVADDLVRSLRSSVAERMSERSRSFVTAGHGLDRSDEEALAHQLIQEELDDLASLALARGEGDPAIGDEG